MTNAEKFKEDFGFEVNQDGCIHKGKCKVCPFYHNGVNTKECASWKFWQSDYQGEPTIPLSVIEKIHDAIDNAESDGFLINENGHMLAMTLTKEHVNEIIDKAVKEYTHE